MQAMQCWTSDRICVEWHGVMNKWGTVREQDKEFLFHFACTLAHCACWWQSLPVQETKRNGHKKKMWGHKRKRQQSKASHHSFSYLLIYYHSHGSRLLVMAMMVSGTL
jgi:hypothetical protein